MADRQYQAEYSKSGRAGCKLCKGAITKGTLRLAELVQSPFFDGKIPQWYHFSCFFKKKILKAVNEVSGFGILRDEDQQKIRAKITGEESTDSPSSSSKKGRKTVITRSDLQVEYAKSNRSQCKSCSSRIEKDEIRIAKMMAPDPVGGSKYTGFIPAWYHMQCFLGQVEELDAAGVSAQELSGFSKLKESDKSELAKKFGTKTTARGKKRKVDESGPSSSAKKTKEDSDEEKIVKEQNKLFWKIRDELESNVNVSSLKLMLETNHQKVPTGASEILSYCADGMVFGALDPCPECSGQYILRGHCYQCTGNISAWTKCTNTTDTPKRSKWVIPEEFKDIPFLKKYKYVPRSRVFLKDLSVPAVESTPDGSSVPSSASSVSNTSEPLKGFSVITVGQLKTKKTELAKELQELGAKVVAKPSSKTTICISNKDELKKMSKKMQEVEQCAVPVVDEEFLEDARKGNARLKITAHTISSWGGSITTPNPASDEPDYGQPSFKSKGSSKVKLTVKGAAAVDPESELETTHHVLEQQGVVYNAVLGLVDLTRGTNSYYKLQLLESDKHGGSYYVFRSWGRVGTSIGGTKMESHGMSLPSALEEFESVYEGKTGNSWHNRNNFVKRPGKFYPLEIDYGQEEDAPMQAPLTGSGSMLAPQVQQLVRMMFDIESMKKAMVEFEIDMKKMPLGKLSKRQIKSAYSVLSELLTEVKGARSDSKLLDASNRFYTLIPHDFGLQTPPLLNSEEIIATKTQMLDNLLEIEVAYRLLSDASKAEGKDPLDVHYETLKTDIEVLTKEEEEYKMLKQYIENTHAATHNQYELELLEVFKVVREGEMKRFKPFKNLHNHMLLWHGSRTTNYAGILSQGLRIAPPEAPVTGYMFGKGVYFADMVSKSANYCRTSGRDPVGLLLLCEVALGDMYERTQAEFVTKLPPGKQSTKGVGRTAPDPSEQRITADGVVVPMGKGKPSKTTATSLLYNEYIVYDVCQIHMKYLLKVNFNYRW